MLSRRTARAYRACITASSNLTDLEVIGIYLDIKWKNRIIPNLIRTPHEAKKNLLRGNGHTLTRARSGPGVSTSICVPKRMLLLRRHHRSHHTSLLRSTQLVE